MKLTSWNSYNLQPANAFRILELTHFHDRVNVILCFIISSVSRVILSLVHRNLIFLTLIDNHLLERIWIFIPSLFLLKIAIPSLSILYMIDDLVDCSLRVKVNAHQWYWSYELADFYPGRVSPSLEFDRYIVQDIDLALTEFRLLETDNRPVLPSSIESQILISRADVLHSWTIPRLGVKADANPGRINHVKLKPHNPGVFYGQCSEICGAYHRFIPISLEFVSAETFLGWAISF
jgi:cytochrome c oxidase subunit 2